MDQSERRRRQRRKARHNEPEPSVGRNTFKVAAARRSAGLELGGIISTDLKPLSTRPSPKVRDPELGLAPPPPREDARKNNEEPRKEKQRATLVDDLRCNDRPERSKRKGGGRGRSFVPWCK